MGLAGLGRYLCKDVKLAWQAIARYYNQELGAYDLTLPKALALLAIPPEGVQPGELGAYLELDSSATTGLLNRLEADGLVVRRSGGADRRTVLVRLTPLGETRRQQVRGIIDGLDDRLRARLTPEGAAAFHQLIATIVDETAVSASTAGRSGR